MPKIKSIHLDGSTLEGGGQLTRVALSLSAITGMPINITKIRANRAPQLRPKQLHGRSSSDKVEGGLKESHLAALRWLARECNAHVEGGDLNSREVDFVPGAAKTKPGVQLISDDNARNTIALERPGSVWLILQALLPYLIFGKLSTTSNPIELTLRGGTNVSKSMSVDYVQEVLIPTLHRIGLPKIEVNVIKRGWAGNASVIGEVKVSMQRSAVGAFSLPAFELTQRGDIEKVAVKIIAGSETAKDVLVEQTTSVIHEHLPNVAIDILPIEDSGDTRRLYILLVAHTTNGWRLGADFLGSGKAPKNAAEEKSVVQNAARMVIRHLMKAMNKGGCVDEFMQDQLVVFQALAEGNSRVDGGMWKDERKNREPECGDEGGSLHTRTVRWVCSEMLRKVGGGGVDFGEGGLCYGVGWNADKKGMAI